jgi:hypothetical protein
MRTILPQVPLATNNIPRQECLVGCLFESYFGRLNICPVTVAATSLAEQKNIALKLTSDVTMATGSIVN